MSSLVCKSKFGGLDLYKCLIRAKKSNHRTKHLDIFYFKNGPWNKECNKKKQL